MNVREAGNAGSIGQAIQTSVQAERSSQKRYVHLTGEDVSIGEREGKARVKDVVERALVQINDDQNTPEAEARALTLHTIKLIDQTNENLLKKTGWFPRMIAACKRLFFGGRLKSDKQKLINQYCARFQHENDKEIIKSLFKEELADSASIIASLNVAFENGFSQKDIVNLVARNYTPEQIADLAERHFFLKNDKGNPIVSLTALENREFSPEDVHEMAMAGVLYQTIAAINPEKVSTEIPLKDALMYQHKVISEMESSVALAADLNQKIRDNSRNTIQEGGKTIVAQFQRDVERGTTFAIVTEGQEKSQPGTLEGLEQLCQGAKDSQEWFVAMQAALNQSVASAATREIETANNLMRAEGNSLSLPVSSLPIELKVQKDANGNIQSFHVRQLASCELKKSDHPLQQDFIKVNVEFDVTLDAEEKPSVSGFTREMMVFGNSTFSSTDDLITASLVNRGVTPEQAAYLVKEAGCTVEKVVFLIEKGFSGQDMCDFLKAGYSFKLVRSWVERHQVSPQDITFFIETKAPETLVQKLLQKNTVEKTRTLLTPFSAEQNREYMSAVINDMQTDDYMLQLTVEEVPQQMNSVVTVRGTQVVEQFSRDMVREGVDFRRIDPTLNISDEEGVVNSYSAQPSLQQFKEEDERVASGKQKSAEVLTPYRTRRVLAAYGALEELCRTDEEKRTWLPVMQLMASQFALKKMCLDIKAASAPQQAKDELTHSKGRNIVFSFEPIVIEVHRGDNTHAIQSVHIHLSATGSLSTFLQESKAALSTEKDALNVTLDFDITLGEKGEPVLTHFDRKTTSRFIDSPVSNDSGTPTGVTPESNASISSSSDGRTPTTPPEESSKRGHLSQETLDELLEGVEVDPHTPLPPNKEFDDFFKRE